MKEKEQEHKRVHDTGKEFLNKNPEEFLNKLNKPRDITINKDEVIKKVEANFLEDDKLEPFINREYAEETIRIYTLLRNKASMGDFDSPQDRAIFDVVEDILRETQNQLN